jgi:hypothetical protein
VKLTAGEENNVVMTRNWTVQPICCKDTPRQRSAEIFLAGVEEQRDEAERKIVLGDNTGDREVMLQPIKFQCAEEWISPELPCVLTN